MFQKASAARLPLSGFDQPKASPLWGFRRAEAAGAGPATADAAAEAAFTPDAAVYGFENFGRAGLQIGGLDRDRQWVGAWGGSC